MDQGEAERTLTLYWVRSINPVPVWVARDPNGAVIAWSRSRDDAMRRAPNHVTCEKEWHA